jgi:hypothetical protein
MKASWILTLIILAGGAIADWFIRGKTTAADHALQSATVHHATSASRKNSTQDAGHPRPRTAMAQDTASLTAGLLAFAKELEAMSAKDDLATLDARQDAMLDWQRRLASLEPVQVKELIAGIRNTPDLDGELRQSIQRLLLDALMERHPLAVLDIITDEPDLVADPGGKTRVISDAMIRGLEQNPVETFEWYKKHRADFPEPTQDIIVDRVLRAAGQTDPALAFRMITDLEIRNIEYAAASIASSARTLDQASESLAAFRNSLPKFDEPQAQEAIRFEVNAALITNSFLHGYDAAMDWIVKAGFSQKELADYISRVRRHVRQDEAPRWLDWIGDNITDRAIVSQVIPELVGDWTLTDHKAAAEWLEHQPDSDVRTAAVQSHALTLSRYQPEVAARWAARMPEGDARSTTMKTVLERWRTSNPAAAEAFAKKHGIRQ